MSEKIEVGSIVDGKVTKIKPFGAIVLLPNNTQGLVHISHISTNYVQDISEHLAIGDTIKVKIISLDSETGKISLSIKEAMEKPKQQKVNSNNYEEAFNHKHNSSVSNSSFEDKFKDWLKISNERHAGLNKRNKRK